MVLADRLSIFAENRSKKGYFRCLWFWDKTGVVQQGCGECFEHSWPARLPRGHSLQNVQGWNGSVDPVFGCRVGSQGHPCQLGQSRSDWGNRGFQSGRHVWQSSQGRDIFVHHIHNIKSYHCFARAFFFYFSISDWFYLIFWLTNCGSRIYPDYQWRPILVFNSNDWPIWHPSSLCCPSFLEEGNRQAWNSHLNEIV